MKHYGFLFDETRCIGCKACQTACKDKNNLQSGIFFRRVTVFQVSGKYFHYSGACNHCEDPLCVKVCPTGAMYKASDCTVQHDDGLCIGCGTCVWSCPYGSPVLDPVTGLSRKCDLCADLRSQNEEPACVQACLTHCLTYEDLENAGTLYSRKTLTRDHPCLPDSCLTDPSILIVRSPENTDPDFLSDSTGGYS